MLLWGEILVIFLNEFAKSACWFDAAGFVTLAVPTMRSTQVVVIPDKN